jgi:hypothetical protein
MPGTLRIPNNIVNNPPGHTLGVWADAQPGRGLISADPIARPPGHGISRQTAGAGVEKLGAHPRRVYLRTTVPLFALSLLVPLTAADTAVSTKLTLAAAHLMAGSIIIPVVTWRLSRQLSPCLAGQETRAPMVGWHACHRPPRMHTLKALCNQSGMFFRFVRRTCPHVRPLSHRPPTRARVPGPP